MKIVVLVKKVPDTASVLKLGPDERTVLPDGLKYILNPYDEFAVEEAIRIKEAKGGEVTAVTAAGEDCEETLRLVLAMGADSALFVKDPAIKAASGRGVAAALAAAIKTLSPDLILAGKQAVDDDAAQVPERVAELLGLPHVSLVTKLELNDQGALATREVEGGAMTVQVPLPALITAQKGLNTPRYPSLPNIMKAKKKEIKVLDLAAIGVGAPLLVPGVTLEKYAFPKQERRNRILKGSAAEGVRELVRVLHEEEKVL